MPRRFDVFLSHNHRDKPVVRELASALRARGLRVWLDEDDLLPGPPWQEEIEKIIQTARAGVVAVGSDGLGPWEDREMRALLSQFVKRRASVIPVLLPGAPRQPELPPFLEEFVWSDLRGGLTPEAVDRLADGIRRRRPSPAGPDPLDRYRVWAAERYAGLSLLGLGAGDLGRLRFEEVYVPLRIVRRQSALESPEALGRHGESPQSDELGIEEIFRTPHASNPHALLLGHPGAGKTTGLFKLLQRSLDRDGSEALGLAANTLPVFLRLRRFTADDLDRPFAEFLQREVVRELGEIAKGKIPADLGARLWGRGRLLLLLDGLDEIADEGHRLRVCGFLDWELADRRDIRAVLSCRFAGYGDKVRLGERFATLEVRPLDTGQCCALVRQWFRAAQGAQPDRLSKKEMLAAAERLTAALDGPGFGSQRWKVLVGSPLLLTLLCVIAYRGGEMPRHRTSFYKECLHVLLGSWSRGRRADPATAEPPLDVETALAVLRALAWDLHSRKASDDLCVADVALEVRKCLAPRGREVSGAGVLDWLYREAGVLADYGEHRYGLLHLGLRALAQQIAADLAAPTAGKAGAVFVLHHPADQEAAVGLTRELCNRGWRAVAAAEDASWKADPERLVREAWSLVVPVVVRACWEERELRSCLELFAYSRSPLVLVDLLPGGGRPALPSFLPAAAPWVDLRAGFTRAGLEALDRALAGVAAPAEVSGELLVEPSTRMRFVWVPGGSFQMGDKGLPGAEPVHRVRVTPFWLGETPVTNAQYAVFLEKTGAAEPQYWRDRMSGSGAATLGMRRLTRSGLRKPLSPSIPSWKKMRARRVSCGAAAGSTRR